jgi:hypothetical protein
LDWLAATDLDLAEGADAMLPIGHDHCGAGEIRGAQYRQNSKEQYPRPRRGSDRARDLHPIDQGTPGAGTTQTPTIG